MSTVNQQRGRIVGRLTRLEGFCRDGKAQTLLACEEVGKKLREIRKDLDAVFEQWMSAQADENRSNAEQEQDLVDVRMDSLEEWLWSTKEGFSNQALHGGAKGDGDSVSSSRNTETRVRLPQLNMVPFSGEVTQWNSWKDQYLSCVHENTDLSNAQKFQYLKTLIQGSAAKYIANRLLSAAEYSAAWKVLLDEYERPNRVVDAYLEKFFNLPTMKSRVAKDLEAIHQATFEIVDGIKLVGSDWATVDVIYCYWIYQKLDQKTKCLWDELNGCKVPTLDNMRLFTRNQLDALRRSTSKQVAVNVLQNESDSDSEQHWAMVAAKQESCILCKQLHGLGRCEKFLSMDVKERRTVVATGRSYFNCLKSGHIAAKCPSTNRCRTCERKHHTTLHQTMVLVASEPSEQDYFQQCIDEDTEPL